MLKRVLETIKKNNMLEAGDKVVCALSGGADSMALLCVLYELREELGISLYAANLNHSIRGDEGDSDSEFVRQFCKEKGIELFYKKVDIPYLSKKNHMSEEECGRSERYRLFEEAVNELGGGVIATGHHRNDNAETVLFNLFRGSGAKGFCGIPYKRGNIIRPLLDVTREDTEKYLKERNIPWRVDSTNGECKYARNNIRLVIIKEIEKLFPKAAEKITSCAEAIGQDDEYLSLLADQSGAFENGMIIAEKFMPLHESLRRRVIIKALKYWGLSVDREKIKAVYDTIVGQTGKGRDLGCNVRIENCYGIIKKEEKIRSREKITEYRIKKGENLEISAFGGVWSIKTVDKKPKMRDNKMMIFLDYDKMGEEVFIRCRKDGDYISPMGMNGTKKLKKVFIDLKIPGEKRDTISMLAEGNEILFIPGIRKSKKYTPDENTKKYFVASFGGINQ